MTVAGATVAFSTIGMAQSATTPATTQTDKVETPQKGDDRGFGKRRFGRDGDEGRKGFGGHHHGGMMRMMHDLNLTEAQKTQIHSIMETNKPNRETMDELRSLATAKHAGTITAEQQVRLTALKQEAHEKGHAVKEQILTVLTPEQKQQLEQKKLERKERFQQHKQMRDQKGATVDPTKETKDN